MLNLSTLRPSDVPEYLSGSELFYAGFGLEECVTERQRRQWKAQCKYELDADRENDPYAEGGMYDVPGYSECRERTFI